MNSYQDNIYKHQSLGSAQDVLGKIAIDASEDVALISKSFKIPENSASIQDRNKQAVM